MQIEKYLQEYQPVIYKTFVNALETNKLSHAYLLSGSVGTPLKDVAIYLAKSLLCDNPNPLACNECTTYMKCIICSTFPTHIAGRFILRYI
jgi:DNA polymerase-3 subunit delta'